MLNFLTSIECLVDDSISNILHRDSLNLIADFEINSLNSKSIHPDFSWLNKPDETTDNYFMNKNEPNGVYNFDSYYDKFLNDPFLSTEYLMLA